MTEVAPFPPVDGSQPCRDTDPELFFPDSVKHEFAEPAIAFCRRCNFIHECLAYALTHGVEGVWGGTTESQRLSLRQKHGIKARTIHSDMAPSFSRADVLRMQANGNSLAEIASSLGVHLSTVKRHLREPEGETA